MAIVDWNSSLSMVRRHDIAILIPHRGDVSPALVPPEVQFSMRTWKTLDPRRILHAPGAINVQGGFLAEQS